jgi:hypothetical protein
MKLGATDIEYSTRVTELTNAWSFIMEKLEGLEVLQISITAQDWKHEDDDTWTDTFLVKACGRVKEPL